MWSDFAYSYLALKKKGLLVSAFTNATLITEDHLKLFRQYPPSDIEVLVYGVTKETYERVIRKPDSFDAFMRWFDILFNSGIIMNSTYILNIYNIAINIIFH